MTIELVVIVITGCISFLDVLVNCFSVMMSGHCNSSCGCCSFQHDEESENTEPKFVFTESVMNMFSKK
jgi:hypothetical protein